MSIMSRSVRYTLGLFRQNAKKAESANHRSFFSRSNISKTPVVERLRDVKPTALITLTIPVASLALGVWQIKRSIWKADVIEGLEARVRRKPINLPDSLEEISNLEYAPVKLTGHFDHSREIILGPRTRLDQEKPASTLLSNSSLAGYFVYTPFKPNDKDYYILVNRGWVPVDKKNPERRKEGQIEGEVEIVGLIRLTEKRPQFVMENDPQEKVWLYRDLNVMGQVADTAPICIDLKEESNVPGGPIGGQTLINLRNVHYSYAITWLTLSLLSGIIWWKSNVPTAIRKVR